MGSVQQGKVFELISMDPTQGLVYYTMETQKVDKPRFERRFSECLNCHGPSNGLVVSSVYPSEDGTPFVKGHKLPSFSNAEEEGYAKADVPFLLEDALLEAGAEVSSKAPWQSKLVVDGRLNTGQNPASGAAVGEAIVAALKGSN